MAYARVKFGETSEIGATFTERDEAAFTIAGATVTIIPSAGGSPLRDGVTAEVDGSSVYYIDSFTAANGYAEDTEYIATFKATIVLGGTTYVEKHEDTFVVEAVADE
jgi:hypothetical protein